MYIYAILNKNGKLQKNPQSSADRNLILQVALCLHHLFKKNVMTYRLPKPKLILSYHTCPEVIWRYGILFPWVWSSIYLH